LPEDEVITAIESWLRIYAGHADHERVTQWLSVKLRQVEEDRQLREVRGKRQEVNALVDRVIRESPVKMTNQLKGLLRDAAFQQSGIPSKEDE